MGYYSIFYSIIIIISLAVILSLTIISNKKVSDKDQDIVNHQHKVAMKKRCMGVCDSRICGQYQERLNDFMECKRCKKRNMCWSKPQGECMECSEQDLKLKCSSSDSYGCENPSGFMKKDVPPINPMQNDCKLCWTNA